MPEAGPKVSVVIPHLLGEETLSACLASLRKSAFRDFEVLLVDNGSTDGSVFRAREGFPEIHVVSLKTNRGFAGGCNAGIREARGEYVFLLNDDAEIVPETLGRLVETADRDARMAACQPKILNWKERTRFDYAGGAGGLMDSLGYPFCLGRVFEHLEQDRGQYEDAMHAAPWCLRRGAESESGLVHVFLQGPSHMCGHLVKRVACHRDSRAVDKTRSRDRAEVQRCDDGLQCGLPNSAYR